MTKAELVNKIYKTMADDVTKRAVEEILDQGFEEVRKAVKKEKRFSYPGFGTFTVRHRQARKGVNPQTSLPMNMPAYRTVGFKPAPIFKRGL